MTTTTAPEVTDLAWSKAALGITLTPAHKRLVGLELARRAHVAESTEPTTGQEVAILRSLAGPACNVFDEFAALVDAYGQWARVEDNVDDVRFEYAPPMSVDGCFEHYGTRLDEAVDALLGESA